MPVSLPSRGRSSYAPGNTISEKYELESVIGEGGMGAVWRARNLGLDLPVAIKVIRGDLNREVLQIRLLQEARAAAKLGHPAIVRVFDVGKTQHGDPFIVMELLQGETLGSLLASSGRLSSTGAVQLLLPIADALSMAHSKRIVHRDLKPDNIFICKSEGQIQPKLVDFGIAKVDKRDGGSFTTQVGAVLGSPEYMSPEQARGEDDLDLRTDVWSFCVVLYEAVTGELPFKGANYNALLRMIVESAPPTLKSLAAGNAELSAIIEQGMSKDRERRWGSMGELGRALATWLVAQGIQEDACGVSLESKWLDRATGMHARPFGDGSSSELEAMPQSGVRGARIARGAAATQPPPGQTIPPMSTPWSPAVGRPGGRAVYAVLGAVALLVAGGILLLRKPSTSHGSELGTGASPSGVGPASELPTPVAESTKVLAPAGSVEGATAVPPSAPSLSVSSATKAPAPRAGAGRAPASPAQKKGKSAKSEPGSDLLAPY
jgi:eukaryotic-like serine/threonine-protein kinase